MSAVSPYLSGEQYLLLLKTLKQVHEEINDPLPALNEIDEPNYQRGFITASLPPTIL